MPSRLCAALAVMCCITTSTAEILSTKSESVEVTIYRDPDAASERFDSDRSGLGLVFINEIRAIDIPAGRSLIRFRGVSDAIVPQTAKLTGLPAIVLESNFDYDLMSPGALIAKSVGASVRLIRTDSTGNVNVTRGILRTGPDGVVVDADGRIEALNCSGLNERLVFDRIPDGLADKPTLSMWIDAKRAGKYEVKLSYLALGLDWSAHYVATIQPDDKMLDLSGWITLVNRYTTTFTDAQTHVVAGRLAREEEETQPPEIKTYRQQARCWPIGSFIVARRHARSRQEIAFNRVLAREVSLEEIALTGSRVAKMSELGDYKLYTLPEPTTVAARQTKQVRLMIPTTVPFQRIYNFQISDAELEMDDIESIHANILLRMQNDEASGLGKPLPTGIISVMEPGMAGNMIFVGEDKIDDIPVGLPVEIMLGRTPDVWISPRVASERHDELDDSKFLVDIEVLLVNNKPESVALEYQHKINFSYSYNITSQSHQHTVKSGNPLWSFTLASGARESLQYTVELTDY